MNITIHYLQKGIYYRFQDFHFEYEVLTLSSAKVSSQHWSITLGGSPLRLPFLSLDNGKHV
jgi:hypothetical protein